MSCTEDFQLEAVLSSYDLDQPFKHPQSLVHVHPYFTLKPYIIPKQYICGFRVTSHKNVILFSCTSLARSYADISAANNKTYQAGQASA